MKGQCMLLMNERLPGPTLYPNPEWPRFRQIRMNEFQALPPGTVVLVRSTSVPLLRDHYFVVTGGLVQKPHGLRPQGISLKAGKDDTAVLNAYTPENGVVALRLVDDDEVETFLNSHTLSDIIL